MELRAYGKMLWRRIWIIALVFGVVAIYVAYQYYVTHKSSTAGKTYTSAIMLRIGLQATQHTGNTQTSYSDYIVASEALADEFTTGPTLTSTTFGSQVSQQVQSDLPAITQQYGANADLGDWKDPGSISRALTAVRVHSEVTISVNWGTEAGSWAIARAVGEVTQNNIATYLDYKVNDFASADTGYPIAAAKVINGPTQPTAVTSATSSKTTLLLALLIVGLIIGTALAFLVEYLDDRIRTSTEVAELLSLPIYGEVPRATATAPTRTRDAASV